MNDKRITAISTAVIAVILVVAAARWGAAIVAPTVLAAMLALTLSPLVGWLERRWVPPGLAAALVVIAGPGLLVGGGYMLAPSAEEWRGRAPAMLRTIETKARDIRSGIDDTLPGGDATPLRPSPGGAEAARPDPQDGGEGGGTPTERVIESGEEMVADLLLGAPALLAAFLYAAFLSFFMLAEKDAIRRSVLGMSPSTRQRLRMGRAMRDMRTDVARYLLTVTVINICLGLLAGCVFWYFGLPNPALWGAMVTALNYMPFIGPMISNVVIFAVGVVTFDSLGAAVYPVMGLVLLNLLEGQLVTPTVVGRPGGAGGDAGLHRSGLRRLALGAARRAARGASDDRHPGDGAADDGAQSPRGPIGPGAPPGNEKGPPGAGSPLIPSASRGPDHSSISSSAS